MLSFSLLQTPPLKTHFTYHNTQLYPLAKSLSFSPYSFQTKTLSGYVSASSNSPVSPSLGDDFNEELDRLLALLPEAMRRKINEHEEFHDLVEVVMDLGRKPLARFPSGDFVLSDCPITLHDIQHATSQVGDFAVDNRAGISRTLHRISAIRNRKGQIIGLTCRVGRAIPGSASLLKDLVQEGASLLLIGPPGVGKTTIIREIARMLASDYKKRVMIVDTSNEIGGDGDIPHGGIGNARRMQVPNSDKQHKVLIEAVENHMPQVIVIDEIGTELEAMAASTIAQRGIQLVATAHGVTIDNLIKNPSLEMLVGGVQSVTLGDEEANRRGVQKTVLERKGPSTFNSGIEIISKNELRVHRSLEATVDAILAGRFPYFETRKLGAGVSKEITETEPSIDPLSEKKVPFLVEVEDCQTSDEVSLCDELIDESPANMESTTLENEPRARLFVYGMNNCSILEASVFQVINQLKLNSQVHLTENISEADALLGLQSRLKKNPKIQAAAKSHNIPIYVTKTSSLVQISKAITTLMNDIANGLEDFDPEDNIKSSERIDAQEEARVAIEQLVIPKGEAVELLPRPPHIISLQIDFTRKYQLQSEKIGTGSDARLRILPYNTKMDEHECVEQAEQQSGLDDFFRSNEDANGSLYSVDRLPFLPE